MATIRAYTTVEQSRKLAEILPLESADYCWGIDVETLCYNNSPYPCAWKDYTCKEYYIPCWSLAALLGVLPRIEDLKPVLDLEINCIQYPSDIDLSAMADNPVDACYEMIIKLHEQTLL